MRVACGVVAAMGCLGLLAGCVTAQQQEKVVLSQRQSAFSFPVDGQWRRSHPSQPLAVLLGRAETTVVLAPRRATLQVGCYRGKPRVRVAYDVGLHSGSILMAYHFDDAAVDQTGTVLVRGLRRNVVAIDYQPTVVAFLTSLRTARSLKVRASRMPFELHDALFKWDPQDPILKDVLAACLGPQPAGKRPAQPADDDDDSLDDLISDVLPAT